MTPIIFDRSRHEALEKCPRLRFLEYEYPNGEGQAHGLTRVQAAVPLLTGAMVHKGIELFLNGFGEGGALDAALSAYDQEIDERGIETDDLAPEPTWVIKVQRALIEALVSGWIGFVYPRIEAEFEILEVEHEEQAVFDVSAHIKDPERLNPTAIMLARTDVLVKRKRDGRVFVRNAKTISDPQPRRIEAFRYDTQTISEVLAVEARLGHQIDGVIYDLLVKGPRKQEYPRDMGVWHNNSPLIWCWKKEGQATITEDEFALNWKYKCDAPHKMGRGQCEGNANHTLGKGWERKLVTDVVPGGVIGWFNWLQTHEPGTIDAQFHSLPPILRTPFDVETWKRSVLSEEVAVHYMAEVARREVVKAGSLQAALPLLDVIFPKHTHNGNCVFPTKCPMHEVCWGTAGDTLEGYVPRQPNHPENVVEVGE